MKLPRMRKLIVSTTVFGAAAGLLFYAGMFFESNRYYYSEHDALSIEISQFVDLVTECGRRYCGNGFLNTPSCISAEVKFRNLLLHSPHSGQMTPEQAATFFSARAYHQNIYVRDLEEPSGLSLYDSNYCGRKEMRIIPLPEGDTK